MRSAVAVCVLLLACEAGATPGASCARDSECASPLVCRMGRCRIGCSLHRDCPLGSACFADETTGTGSCRLPVEGACASDADCPPGTVCEGSCRAACASYVDCAGLACRTVDGRSYCDDPVMPAGDGGVARRGLVINEIDLVSADADAIGDCSVFVEVFNAGDTAVDATAFSIRLTVWAARTSPITRTGTSTGGALGRPGTMIPPGGYSLLLLGPGGIGGLPGMPPPDGYTSEACLNPHPDMPDVTIELFDDTASAYVDEVAFGPDPEGSPAATFFATTDPGTPATTLARIPNGRDTDALGDWALSLHPTPGWANRP